MKNQTDCIKVRSRRFGNASEGSGIESKGPWRLFTINDFNAGYFPAFSVNAATKCPHSPFETPLTVSEFNPGVSNTPMNLAKSDESSIHSRLITLISSLFNDVIFSG